MRVQYNFAKKETWRDVIDVSNYTGMEVEHGLNTGNLHMMSEASNLGHFDPNSNQQSDFTRFMAKAKSQSGNLRDQAL